MYLYNKLIFAQTKQQQLIPIWVSAYLTNRHSLQQSFVESSNRSIDC